MTINQNFSHPDSPSSNNNTRAESDNRDDIFVLYLESFRSRTNGSDDVAIIWQLPKKIIIKI